MMLSLLTNAVDEHLTQKCNLTARGIHARTKRYKSPHRDFLSLAARRHGFTSTQDMVLHARDTELDRIPLCPHYQNQKDILVHVMQTKKGNSHPKRHHISVEVITGGTRTRGEAKEREPCATPHKHQSGQYYLTPLGTFNRVVKKWLGKAANRYTARMMNMHIVRQISSHSLRRGLVHNHFLKMIASGTPIRHELLQRKLR
jgi:hypothetical protein